ncbi:MAG: glycosyltransferase [Candidatus Eisenbacteria sp.]|nr:glycosyltransferase [Candidatus Eisenbacteria bacterium]
MSSPQEADLSIVIVGYNSLPELRKCLSSVRETGTSACPDIVVVDNASADRTVEFLQQEHPEVRLVANGRNVGYSRAVNQGIAEAKARYILVLNPDIVVLPGALDRLVSFMDEHPDVGIAGAKLLNPDGSLQYSCRRFYTFWTLVLRRTPLGKLLEKGRTISNHLMLEFDHEESREVDWVIGACMIVRRMALADFGGMDERFFLYFEDVDWCYRVWQSGWKVWYVADSVMRHRHVRESARPGLSKQLITHGLSMIHFYEKWGKAIYGLKKYRPVLTNSVLLLSDLVAINGGFGLAYALRSSLHGLLAKPMFGVSMYGTFLAFANLVFVFSYAFFGLYGTSIERERASNVTLRVFRAAPVAAIILMASTFLTSRTIYSRVLVAAFCVLAVVLTVVLRMGLRKLHGLVRAGRFDLTRAAVVGTDETSRRVAERLLSHSALGYDLAGLVATNGDERPPGFAVIGRLEELPELIEKHRIGEVIFADPEISYEKIADFLIKARRSAVDVKMVSGLTGILTQRAKVAEFLDLPVVAFEREALLRAGAGIKRSLDVVGAALLIAAWAPLLLVTSVATLIGRRTGPLSSVERAGLGGRTFNMHVLNPSNEPSALRRFALRHGLSVFPSVINVLRGDMSFVGPRVVAPVDTQALGLRERLRFDARPGITSLAGVSAVEGTSSPDELAALDAYYVQDWSLGGDAKILMRRSMQCLLGWAHVSDEHGSSDGSSAPEEPAVSDGSADHRGS